jgi:hypothetical protein
MGDVNAGGISKLLAAEQEAQQIVDKARKGARAAARAAGAPECRCEPSSRPACGRAGGSRRGLRAARAGGSRRGRRRASRPALAAASRAPGVSRASHWL